MENSQIPEIPRPDAEFLITNLETLKVISEPLRIRVLELLSDDPRTVKQLAAAMEMAATKLYYHVNMLELHGLIRITGTRLVSGILEKQYQATAYSYRVDRTLLTVATPGEDQLSPLVTIVFDHARDHIKRGIASGLIDLSPARAPLRKLAFTHTSGRIGTERAGEFCRRLEELIREFDQVASDSPDGGHMYGMVLTLYPLALPPAEEGAP